MAGPGAEIAQDVRMRLIQPDDEWRLIELYDHLSEHSIYQRFFTLMPRLPRNWAHDLANVDYATRLALVLEHEAPDGPELVGVARYEPSPDPRIAEVAFVVRDEFQGQGYGKRLLDALLAAAGAKGITRFRAYVLADNRRMLGMLARHTRIVDRSMASGVSEVIFEPRS
jgi:RimJ/RimL family protein N-acetyltransferase